LIIFIPSSVVRGTADYQQCNDNTRTILTGPRQLERNPYMSVVQQKTHRKWIKNVKQLALFVYSS